jgi:hypothetical protein
VIGLQTRNKTLITLFAHHYCSTLPIALVLHPPTTLVTYGRHC